MTEQPVARAPRPQRTKPAASRAAPKEWAKKARKTLEENDLGPEWAALVNEWWVREESKGFESPVKGLSATGRPGEISWWVQRARGPRPHLKEIKVFAQEFSTWWQAINPPWRRSSLPMAKQTGDWASMDVAGPNGFLSVLMCLKWWREELENASPEWKEAADDVLWVLRRMNG
ncbi:hypothetical protein DFH06DRAFT_1004536 [Mycena polygramma]|nr:hypothetical protein DFH06DRAFT_1004536 [Mycena polygramma]